MTCRCLFPSLTLATPPARARTQSTYMEAFYRAAQLTVDASSQVRENYGAYRTAYDISKHYRDEIDEQSDDFGGQSIRIAVDSSTLELAAHTNLHRSLGRSYASNRPL